jgi:hypothetical protein
MTKSSIIRSIHALKEAQCILNPTVDTVTRQRLRENLLSERVRPSLAISLLRCIPIPSSSLEGLIGKDGYKSILRGMDEATAIVCNDSIRSMHAMEGDDLGKDTAQLREIFKEIRDRGDATGLSSETESTCPTLTAIAKQSTLLLCSVCKSI